jgi:hypothetical protein
MDKPHFGAAPDLGILGQLLPAGGQMPRKVNPSGQLTT